MFTDTKPLLVAITCPAFTESHLFTLTVAGAPICCDIGTATVAGISSFWIFASCSQFIFGWVNTSYGKCFQHVIVLDMTIILSINCFSLNLNLGFRGGKLISSIDPVRHALATHFLQKVHLFASIYARLFSNIYSVNSFFFLAFKQAMHATLQALLAGNAYTQFEQATYILRSFFAFFS